MKTAVIYYSQHHGNTKKLLDAMAMTGEDIELIDVTDPKTLDLSGFDRVGLASGIYYGGFAKQLAAFAKEHLPEGVPVFFVYTHGAPKGEFLKSIREVTLAKGCPELGEYRCQGFDTFGPFKLVGGLAKGHPTQKEIEGAAEFFRKLPSPEK